MKNGGDTLGGMDDVQLRVLPGTLRQLENLSGRRRWTSSLCCILLAYVRELLVDLGSLH